MVTCAQRAVLPEPTWRIMRDSGLPRAGERSRLHCWNTSWGGRLPLSEPFHEGNWWSHRVDSGSPGFYSHLLASWPV